MAEPLQHVLDALQKAAPLELAADWDNVGLLLDPSPEQSIEVILLCIDLTEMVMNEALARAADLIVAYHPPIFSGLKRLTQSVPLQRSLLRAAREGISIYSPHTALDAAAGGVNDWLADGVGPGTRTILEPCPANPELGQGRLVTLDEPASAHQLVERMKRHLRVSPLRAAFGRDPSEATLKTVALCPGSGGSVIGTSGADVLLTGEMKHHDVLAAAGRGQVVLLSEHTHTERGYLPILQKMLADSLVKVEISIASSDADPIVTV